MPYVAPERLYVDAAGTVYKETDLTERSVVSLLIHAGGELSDEDAKKYGLTGKKPAATVETATVDDAVVEPEPEPEAKAVSAPPANKARRVSTAESK